MSLEDMDRFIVTTALEQAEYNMTAAARNLGTTRQTLRYRAQKYGIKAPEEAGADHLKALARVSRLLRDRTTCEKLRGSDDPAALYALLIETPADAAA